MPVFLTGYVKREGMGRGTNLIYSFPRGFKVSRNHPCATLSQGDCYCLTDTLGRTGYECNASFMCSRFSFHFSFVFDRKRIVAANTLKKIGPAIMLACPACRCVITATIVQVKIP